MQPLPLTPGDFLAPAPSGNQPVGSPPGGEESFSKHLAIETARESTDDVESALSYGKEMVGGSPLLNQRVPETFAQIGLSQNGANVTDQILLNQQSNQLNTQILSGAKNQDASPLMVLLDKLSTQKSTTDSLAGNAQSVAFISAALKGTSQAEVSAQPQKTSALQQQLAALSEILTPAQSAKSSLQPDALQSVQEGVKSALSGTTVQFTPANEASPSVIVEQWSATFKPVQTQNTAATSVTTLGDEASPSVTTEQWSTTFKPVQTQNTAATSTTPLGENVIKTDNGQTITIYQSSDNEEMAVATPLAARPSTVDQSGQRQDANSNYLHSNLPNNTVKATLGAEGEQQAKNGGEQQPDPKNVHAADEPGTDTRLGRESAPVPFTLDSVVPTTASTLTSPTTTPGAGLMKLPSGATFQQSTVVDQVIHQFSGTQKLESGSIRLQLHPQELGELRMEIEVKQDNVKAHITAQNPQAQEALERHLPRLRETLQQQGLHLNEVEITVAAGEQYEGNHFQQNNAKHQLGASYRGGNISNTGLDPITANEPSPINVSQQGLSVTV